MPDSVIQLTTGFLLNERYLVQRELGRGGVGVVYLAHDEQLHSRPVVIKVLLEESYRDEWIKTKFRQEMEALSRLDHPGIVQLLNTGELVDGRPFLVMQYVEGALLRSLIRPDGMDVDRAAVLIKQIGDALSAAHGHGVLHRDLKPENIMIQSPGGGEQIKIIDFGLAKVFNSRVAESTSIPNVAGSFSYMSPEQLMARPVSAASDVYSFAVIVYEMLTGRRPYNPESLFQLLDMLRSGVRVKPRDLRPSLPEAVDALMLSALAYDPAARPAGAGDLGRQLHDALLKPDSAVPQLETQRVSGLAKAPHGGIRIAAWLSIILAGCTLLLLAREVCYRFQSWQYFLTRPAVWIPAALWFVAAVVAPAQGLLRGGPAFLLDRLFGRYRPAHVGLVLAASALMLLPFTRNRQVISGELVHGKPETRRCCALKYSDPRGYRYTFQENSYYHIRILPDRFNLITDYRIRITLPPELEFADIYSDKSFPSGLSLNLEPSSTNDILRLQNEGDDFTAARDILFTTKYRSSPAGVRIRVELNTPGDSLSYDF